MWLLVMFDPPVKTPKQRKLATGFRKSLLEDGFAMMRFSIYSRPCPSDENAAVHQERVKRWLPPEGSVRILKITDKQFERAGESQRASVSFREKMLAAIVILPMIAACFAGIIIGFRNMRDGNHDD